MEELKRQLTQAKQQADSDLAVQLDESRAAAQKLQERCARLEAEMAHLQASCQMPCMPWVSAGTALLLLPAALMLSAELW